MAKSEKRACPACGTLRCVACTFKRQNASRFAEHADDAKGHNLVMVPVVHRHTAKREDHELHAAGLAAMGWEPKWPLQGHDYARSD